MTTTTCSDDVVLRVKKARDVEADLKTMNTGLSGEDSS